MTIKTGTEKKKKAREEIKTILRELSWDSFSTRSYPLGTKLELNAIESIVVSDKVYRLVYGGQDDFGNKWIGHQAEIPVPVAKKLKELINLCNR